MPRKRLMAVWEPSRRPPAALLLLCALVPTAAAAQARPSRAAEQVYTAACAHCHGVDGRGVPAARLALPVEPPDFTDCNFASREPDSDWGAIIAAGGPARAFHRMMPAFGAALSRDETALALSHVRTFCGDPAWPRGDLNLPRALVTEKAFPEDEFVITSAIAAEGPGSTTTRAIYEKRFGARNQVEFVVPVAANGREGGSWQGGLGDAAIGIKRVLAHSLRRGSIVSVTGEAILPTGDAGRGLGKGFAIFEPFVTVGQLLPSDGFLQFQGGFEFPTNREKGANEAFWRVAVGKSFAQDGGTGRTWSPMIEILGAKELVDDEHVQWDLLPQMQVTLSTRQHIMLNLGIRLPLTERGRATQFVAYLLWDWFDGGFFEGW